MQQINHTKKNNLVQASINPIATEAQAFDCSLVLTDSWNFGRVLRRVFLKRVPQLTVEHIQRSIVDIIYMLIIDFRP